MKIFFQIVFRYIYISWYLYKNQLLLKLEDRFGNFWSFEWFVELKVEKKIIEAVWSIAGQLDIDKTPKSHQHYWKTPEKLAMLY